MISSLVSLVLIAMGKVLGTELGLCNKKLIVFCCSLVKNTLNFFERLLCRRRAIIRCDVNRLVWKSYL